MTVAAINAGFKPTPIAQGIALATGKLAPLCTRQMPFRHELQQKEAHHVGDPRAQVFNRRKG